MALSLLAAVATPTAAWAGHHHSRYCRHGNSGYYGQGYRSDGYYDESYRSDRYYDDGYNRGQSYGGYYDPYAYGYREYRYYDAPRRPYVPYHYHRGVRCYRRHVGVFFGW